MGRVSRFTSIGNVTRSSSPGAERSILAPGASRVNEAGPFGRVPFQRRRSTSDNRAVNGYDSILSHPVTGDRGARFNSTPQETHSAAASSFGAPAISHLAVVLLLGAWFILPSLGERSLSHAEAYRARRIEIGTLADARRLPPLQFVLLSAIHKWVPDSEAALRAPSAIAGLVCAAIVLLLAQSIVGRLGALFAGLFIVSQPLLIAHARELKEFAIEAAFVALLFYSGLLASRVPSIKRLFYFHLTALIGLGMTFTSSLAVVAWWPVLTLNVIRKDVRDRKTILVHALLSLVLLLAGICWYIWLAGFQDRGVFVNYYYTEIEPSWPVSYAPGELSAWLGDKLFGTVCYTLGISQVWSPLKWCVGSLGLVALAAGLGRCWGQARALVLASMAILLLAVASAMMRMWPIGNVRQVAFLIPLAALFVGVGVFELARRVGWRSPATWLIVAGCVAIPVLRATKASLGPPAVYEHIRPVVERMASEAKPGDAVLVYYSAADAFHYYWKRQDCTIVEQPTSDRDRPDLLLRRFEDLADSHHRVWFVSAHDWKTERRDWMDLLSKQYEQVEDLATVDANGQLFDVQSRRQSATIVDSP